MEIIEKIKSYYTKIGNNVKKQFEDQIVLNYETNLNPKLNQFSVSLEIIIANRKSHDDYGLIYCTNAQNNSHFNANLSATKELFLISDISYGDGTIIDSTEEIMYNASDPESNKIVTDTIERFILKRNDFIIRELIDHYGLNNSF